MALHGISLTLADNRDELGEDIETFGQPIFFDTPKSVIAMQWTVTGGATGVSFGGLFLEGTIDGVNWFSLINDANGNSVGFQPVRDNQTGAALPGFAISKDRLAIGARAKSGALAGGTHPNMVVAIAAM